MLLLLIGLQPDHCLNYLVPGFNMKYLKLKEETMLLIMFKRYNMINMMESFVLVVMDFYTKLLMDYYSGQIGIS